MISKLGMSNSTQVANRIKAKKGFWGIEKDYQRDALVVFEFFFIKLWSKLLKNGDAINSLQRYMKGNDTL